MSKRKQIDKGQRPYTQSAFEESDSSNTGESDDFDTEYTRNPNQGPIRNDDRSGRVTPLKRDLLETLASRQSVVLALWTAVIGAIIFFIHTGFSVNSFLGDVRGTQKNIETSTQRLEISIEKINTRIDLLIDRLSLGKGKRP